MPKILNLTEEEKKERTRQLTNARKLKYRQKVENLEKERLYYELHREAILQQKKEYYQRKKAEKKLKETQGQALSVA